MTGMLASWLLFPVVAVAIALGHGLLAERVAGLRVPGALLLPLGLAGLVVSSQLATTWSWSARLTVPFVVLVALAGFACGARRLRATTLDAWAIAAALVVFACFAAPIVLSGEPTFAGYSVLGDTAIHFIGADALLDRGRDFGHLAPSSYKTALVAYYGASGYPSGGPTSIGALRPLTGQDVAWIFQPYLALLMVGLALVLYLLAGAITRSRVRRALVAAVAAQPALIYAYALQGSVKELGMVLAFTLLAACAALFMAQPRPRARAAVLVAVPSAAAVGFLGPSALVWVGPVLLATAVVAALRWRELRAVAGAVAVFVAAFAVGALPAWLDLRDYVNVASAVATSASEFGNLRGPLNTGQLFGIWLSSDYRWITTGAQRASDVLIAVAVVGIAMGIAATWRRRAFGVGLYAAASLLGWAYVSRNGSPWADAKALTIASPALVLLAMLGAVALYERRAPRARAGAKADSARRGRSIGGPQVAGLVVGLAVVGGVLGSNALGYHGASLAPYARLHELGQVGQRYAHQGPVLYPEFEEFAKHFLRRTAPEGSAEAWRSRPPLPAGPPLPGFGRAMDVDQLAYRYVASYRTLVVRRGPLASRPPSSYRRVWHGRFYDVWQRAPDAPRILVHQAVTGDAAMAAMPACGLVRRLAGIAARHGAELRYAPRAGDVASLAVDRGPRPRYWKPAAGRNSLQLVGPGTLMRSFVLARAARVGIWLEGSFGRPLVVRVDGHRVGSVGNRLDNQGVTALAGAITLGRGRHEVSVTMGGRSLAPGDGGLNRMLGAIHVASVDPAGEVPVISLPARDWRQICGRSVDWIEVASPSSAGAAAQP